MAIQKLTPKEFLNLANQHLVLDVRSPGEFLCGHIPNAQNLPLFSNDERKIVGTAYKQVSKQEAIKIGLDFFGIKMRTIVQTVEEITNSAGLKIPLNTQDKHTVLVHCWRGGMRSAGVAWLLDLYGFNVCTLIGGYKAYRNWVINQFAFKYNFKLIGGFTGSGKTLLLKALNEQKNTAIDLEALANHKGSALGALGQAPQPSQEMFENLLAKNLSLIKSFTENEVIFLEDESQRIGNLQIPNPIWLQMRQSKVYFFNIPFGERLDYLNQEYGKHSKDELTNAIIRIQKRLGGMETKNAINHLVENDTKECFRILLTYYDKWYKKGVQKRENAHTLITEIISGEVNTKTNLTLLQNLL